LSDGSAGHPEVGTLDTGSFPSAPSPRIVVVGPCASGKSTLAAGLREHGYDALVSGQEHSEVPTLWRRPEPDVVIALRVDLSAIRRRRDDRAWPGWLLERQRQRLRQATAAAGIVIDTSHRDAQTVLNDALSQLAQLTRA
jgi:adenylate kinase family enzyme